MISNKKILIGSALIAMTALSSCLKDTAVPPSDPLSGTNSVVAFIHNENVTTATSLYPQYAKDFKFPDDKDTLGYNINVGYLGAEGGAPQDITVTLAIDAASLAAFNANQGSNYVVPAANVVSIPTTLTIPKGQYMATGRLVVTKTNFDFSKNYGLAIKITAASGGVISTNSGVAVYTLAARNKYDGVYSVTSATMTDAVNAGLVAPATPYNIELRTTGLNSVVMYDPVYSKTLGHWIMNGSSSSYYGSFSPVFTIATDGKITSIVNSYGQPAANGRAAQMDATADNKYDAATKTFTVNYFMIENGNKRVVFSEKYKYSKAR